MTDGSENTATGELPFDVTQTAEFKTAVALAAGQAAQDAVANVLAQLQMGAKSGPANGDNDVMEKLALAIAELTDQGVGVHKVRVAPEILVQRAKAHDRMIDLLHQVHDQGLIPEYRLRDKIYVAHQVVEPFTIGNDKIPRPTEIEWRGVPNGCMVPLNDIAKAIYAEYKASIGLSEAKGTDKRPSCVTAGGLVVKGAPPMRRLVSGIDSDVVDYQQQPAEEDHGFRVRSPVDPNAKEVRVLGTIAAPARQNYAQGAL